ncbi:MAG: YlxR family protein [Oscillospiraceae bacterium]|nr:YlxR family protein [Ruminococcus sp.]MDD7337740.1 YlxR family protein [Ruminococcus sp.]MDY6061803.1 YlxR family protein [Oscillospiraceae bacterium]
MQNKKVPLRKCTGCGEMKPKKELVRVVKTPEGEISLDPTGKMNGRGAYLCKDPQCLRKAQKSKRIEKALSCTVPDEIYNKLEQELISSE